MKKLIKIAALCTALTVCLACLMSDIDKRFGQPTSFVVFNQEGELLGAKIASDEQWRFPLVDSLPTNYKKALLTFEDKRFYSHCGVDVRSVARAMKDNLASKRIVSGASTITMQLMRLDRAYGGRTVKQKLKEMALAFVYTLKYDKETILHYYATHAPFGGNVVGAETASWRYFGRSLYDLSWAEAATLAVLPNSPAMMHPGKNRDRLEAKRDRLLLKLYEEEVIDQMEYELAIEESLPLAPAPLPMLNQHYVEKLFTEANDSHKVIVDINSQFQTIASNKIDIHEAVNRSKGVNNAAIIIRDTKTSKVLAYVGNTSSDSKGSYNDMVMTARSSGSILKPFLYAYMMDEALLAPDQLISDVPVHIDGFRPKNYDRNFRGVIPASEALSMSLNVPFVMMSREYGVSRFIKKLRKEGLSTIRDDADHYGLSIILGGAEVNLFELTHAYSNFGQILLNKELNQTCSPGAIYHMLEAMYTLQRPGEDNSWEQFTSSKKIAWKTGTSYGHRDAWAVAITPEYTIGVWVGNANGEARPEIIGSSMAGPLLFDVIHALPATSSFEEPLYDLQAYHICSKSGMKAHKDCPETKQNWLAKNMYESKICTFHEKVVLDGKRDFLVHKDCSKSYIDTSWFVLSPRQAHYFKKVDPAYQAMPVLHPNCQDAGENAYLDIVYPQSNSSFVIPNNLKEEREKIICEVAHQFEGSKVYWHLDDKYLGMTEEFHKMPIETSLGMHKLYVIDENGYADQMNFEVLK